MNLIKEVLIDAILQEHRQKNTRDNERIINKYNSLTKQSADQVDDIFISICGFSLENLISASMKEVDNETV